MQQNHGPDAAGPHPGGDEYEEFVLSDSEVVSLLSVPEELVSLSGKSASASERERARKTVSFLRELEKSVTEPGDKAQLLHDAGQLLGRILDLTDEGLDCARRAFELQPHKVSLARGYRKALRLVSAHDSEVWEALTAEARAATCPSHQATLHVARGVLAEILTEDLSAARLAYETALAANPKHLPALLALERLEARAQKTTRCAIYARRAAENTGHPDVRGERWVRAAHALAQSGSVKEAWEYAQLARACNPSSPSLLFLMERLCTTGETFLNDLLSLREEQLRKEVISNTASGWFDIGVLARYRLHDRRQATSAFETALALLNDEPAARLLMTRELCRLAAHHEEWEKLAALECERARYEPSSVGRAAAWHRCGVVWERHLHQPAKALECWESALIHDGNFSPASLDLIRLYHEFGVEQRLVSLWQREAEQPLSPAEKAELLCLLGAHLWKTYERPDRAIEAFRQGLQLCPSHLPTAFHLEYVFFRERDWSALSELYRLLLDQDLPAPLRCWWQYSLGELLSTELGNPEEGTRWLEGLRQLDGPPPPLHLFALARNLGASRRLEELGRLLEELRPSFEEAQASAGLLHHLAEVHQQRGDFEAAARACSAALDLAPHCAEVLACAKHVFLRTNKVSELVSRIEAFARSQSGPEEELGHWLGLAAHFWAHVLADPQRALTVVRVAAARAPQDPTIRVLFLELLALQHEWNELQELVTEFQTDASDLLQLTLLHEASGQLKDAASGYARLCDQGVSVAAMPLVRTLIATEQWQLLFDFGDTPLGRALHVPVQGLYRQAFLAVAFLDRPEAAGQLWRQCGASPTPDLAALVSLFDHGLVTAQEGLELGRTLMGLLSEERDKLCFLAHLHQLLLLQPPSLEVTQAQLELFNLGLIDPVLTLDIEVALERKGERKILLDVLRRVLDDPALPPDLRADALAAVAGLLEELGALQQAAEALQSALSVAPTAGRIADRVALARIQGALGDFALYAEALKQLADALPRGSMRTVVLRLYASHQFFSLKNCEAAVSGLEEALREAPLDYRLLSHLDFLLEERHQQERLLPHLGRAFAAEQDPARLSALGTLLAHRLLSGERAEQAQEVLNRTLAVCPNSLEALALMAELRRQQQQWPSLAELLERISSHTLAPPWLQQRASYVLALVHQYGLKNPEAARRIAQDLVNKAAEDADSLELLLALQQLVENAEATLELVQKLSQHHQLGPAERAQYLLHLADLQEQAGLNPLEIIATLGHIEEPRAQATATERLLRLAESSGHAQLAADRLSRFLETTAHTDPATEQPVRRALATLLDQTLQKGPEAVPHYERLVQLDPSGVETLTRLAELTLAATPEKAVDHQRSLLALKPESRATYRALRQLFVKQQLVDSAFCVEATLTGLGWADEEETYYYHQRRPRLPRAPQHPLGPDDLSLLCPEYGQPVTVLLRFLQALVTNVFPLDLSAHGLSDADPEPPAELAQAAHNVAALFGLPPLRCHLSPRRYGPTVLPLATPVLLVPPDFVEALPREQLAVFGALCCRIAVGGLLHDPLQLQPLTDLQRRCLFRAALELLAPGSAEPPEHPTIHDDIKNRLAEVWPTAIPDEVQTCARQVVDQPSVPLLAPLPLVFGQAAAQAATLAAIDPAAAIGALRRWPLLTGTTGDDTLIQGLPRIAWTATVFAVSHTHQLLRKRLGLELEP